MKAVGISGKLAELDRPVMGPTDVRIRVKAAALNRADLLQMKGHYPAPSGAPADILGMEYAGEVVEVGSRVAQPPGLGTRVLGIVGGGAFAEEVVVNAREAIPFPASLSFEQAAAIPEAFFTAHDALMRQGGLRPGESVLVHAVGSGVGTAAVQLIHAYGAVALGTARTQGKLDRARNDLGLKHGILCGSPAQFASEVRRLTGDVGAQLCLELVGGSYLPETLDAMATRGRVVLIGLLAGASANLALSTVLSKRISVIGTVLRSRPLEEKISLAQQCSVEVMPLFSRGAIKPVVDQVFSFRDFSHAVARMGANENFGKCVLTWEGTP